jgi:hypothetical protein
MNRRNFILGGSAFGISMPQILKAQYGNNAATAKNIIHIFLSGGISHQESFDPKPLAPSEYRGPFGAIETVASGIQLGSQFSETAKIADKIAIINSMTHGQAAHERGTESMFTGYKPSPALSYPSFGSVISHELETVNNLPKYVSVPNQANEFAGTGFLSTKHGSFSLGSDPASPDFQVRDLNIPVTTDQFDRRRNILETVNTKFDSETNSDAVDSIGKFYDQAYDLIGSKKATEAFDITMEPQSLVERYGSGQAGKRFLISRRLVESGVRMVSVTFGSWDHHDNIKVSYERYAPELDKAYAALIADLDERGLLSETLVLLSTEFGRTPKINNTSGRDHWPRVFSSVMAGGGIQGGVKYGASDSLASEVDEDPVSPSDLAATMYHAIGVDPKKELMTADLRPIKIIDGGKILDLF